MQSRRVRKNKRRAPSNEVFWGAPSPPLQHLNPSRMRALSRTGNHFYSPSCQKKNTPPPPPEEPAPPDLVPEAVIDLRRLVWGFIKAAPKMPNGGERRPNRLLDLAQRLKDAP